MKLTALYCVIIVLIGCAITHIVNKFILAILKQSESDRNYDVINFYQLDNNDETNDTMDIAEDVINYNNMSESNSLLPLEEAIRTFETNGSDFESYLIRKRRFLIFPDGCSFQTVFCLTYFTVIPIADIFYLGATAAFAWELPSDPSIFFKNKRGRTKENRKDQGVLTYKDGKGSIEMNQWEKRILVNRFTGETIQPFTKNYYNNQYNLIKKISQNLKKSTIIKENRKNTKIKPVFAKRSINNTVEVQKNKTNKRKKRTTLNEKDIEKMHKEQEERKYFNAKDMDDNVIDFHRTSRYTFYEKIEKLILGIGFNGRECILKALCEVGQDRVNAKQGTFLDEISRVVFTLNKGRERYEKYEKYDTSSRAQYKCADVHPECSFSIKSLPMK